MPTLMAKQNTRMTKSSIIQLGIAQPRSTIQPACTKFDAKFEKKEIGSLRVASSDCLLN